MYGSTIYTQDRDGNFFSIDLLLAVTIKTLTLIKKRVYITWFSIISNLSYSVVDVIGYK